jgi:hypothetical protein
LATEGTAYTLIVTLDDEGLHGALVIVQVNTYVPAPPRGENVDVGLAELLNWLAVKFGPLATVHAPVPTVGVLAARVVLPVTQIFCVTPALAGVGLLLNVTLTLLEEVGQAPLAVVHCKRYDDPATPVNDDVGLYTFPNAPPEPPVILHIPVPTDGVFPARLTVFIPQVEAPVIGEPAFAVVGKP